LEFRHRSALESRQDASILVSICGWGLTILLVCVFVPPRIARTIGLENNIGRSLATHPSLVFPAHDCVYVFLPAVVGCVEAFNELGLGLLFGLGEAVTVGHEHDSRLHGFQPPSM